MYEYVEIYIYIYINTYMYIFISENPFGGLRAFQNGFARKYVCKYHLYTAPQKPLAYLSSGIFI